MEWSVARHQAIAGKLIAELHIQTIRINIAARVSVIFAGYVMGSVIAQYLGKDYDMSNYYYIFRIVFIKLSNNIIRIHLTDLSMLITHKFNILAVVPRTSRLCHTSQISLPNIHFFAIASSIALLVCIY